MSCLGRATTMTFLLGVALCSTGVDAFEIQLKEDVACRSAVIRLGDIAVITGVDQQLLVAMERIALAPAPVPSATRCLTASQIRTVLTRHGVALDGCHFTGAARVHVQGNRRSQASAGAGVGVQSHVPSRMRHDMNSVKDQVVKAVINGLESQDPNRQWQVDVTLTRRRLWDLPEKWQHVRIVGLTTSAENQQEVTAEFSSGQETVRIPVKVRIDGQAMAVVATRLLNRGDVLQAGDIELCTIESGRRTMHVVNKLKDVIGKEMKERVLQGQLVGANTVRSPLLVRRRDIVDVVARSGSITVRRQALARSDGALGDTIQLKTSDADSTPFRARVIGRRQAEVTVGMATVRHDRTTRM